MINSEVVVISEKSVEDEGGEGVSFTSISSINCL